MFYLPLAVLTWIACRWFVDRRRLPEHLVYGLTGATLATVQDRLVLMYRLWEYRDVGPLDSHAEIALLISLSAAPIFALRFAQGLEPGAPLPWRRVLKFTAVSMLPEIVALYSGNIRYDHWWNAGWSVAAYIPIWTAIWALHRWMTAPLRAPVPLPAETTTAPGT